MSSSQHPIKDITKLYDDWFLSYASYVILDRAVPHIDDGLKPVQRRLLHALNELDDGRYTKAANVIGHTMRYHPHGDGAIGEALVKLAQKDLLIDTQGNWGNVMTGDRAAAPRYIEARLTPFAKHVLFSESISEWQKSYDGRNDEPIILPVKFPLLLFLGAEGIAVGLSTRIMPHNFCEILKESIAILKGFSPNLLPDFPSGGCADFAHYMDGRRGGKIIIQSHIEVVNARTLRITEVPYGLTTPQLIESILNAHEKGKVKIKKIEDNTAEHLEILVHLPPGTVPEEICEQLYRHTECQTTLHTSACVIQEGKPRFLSVSEILTHSVHRIKDLLGKELSQQCSRLENDLFQKQLEKLFVEHRFYKILEKSASQEEAFKALVKSFKPFLELLGRAPDEDALTKLTDMKIRRISFYDSLQAEEKLKEVSEVLRVTRHHRTHLTEYAIKFLEDLLRTYGGAFPRRTKITTLGGDVQKTVNGQMVVSQGSLGSRRQPLTMQLDRKKGFLGVHLKDADESIVIPPGQELVMCLKNGTIVVPKLEEDTQKFYWGKDLVCYFLIKPGDEECLLHVLYTDEKASGVYATTVQISSAWTQGQQRVTRQDQIECIYVSRGLKQQSHKVKLYFAKKSHGSITVDFHHIPVRMRPAQGVKVTDYSMVRYETLSSSSASASYKTPASYRLWLDKSTGVLNTEGMGIYAGKCTPEDSLWIFYASGAYELCLADVERRFPAGSILEAKRAKTPSVISLIYFDESRNVVFAKKWVIEVLPKFGLFELLDLSCKGVLLWVSVVCGVASEQHQVKLQVEWDDSRSEVWLLDQAFITKSAKALGTKMSSTKPLTVREL